MQIKLLMADDKIMGCLPSFLVKEKELGIEIYIIDDRTKFRLQHNVFKRRPDYSNFQEFVFNWHFEEDFDIEPYVMKKIMSNVK